MKLAKILFFVLGASPTAENFAEAQELRANVAFRNAHHVPSDGCLEECDGVAGEVPERYAEAFPSAEEAIAARDEEIKALQACAGDEAPPQKPKVEKTKASAASKPAPTSAWKPNA